MTQEKRAPNDRGRLAQFPWEISLSGWYDIVLRIKEDLINNNVSIIAAGVAFYAFLSLFPALLAIVSLYGMIADPTDVQQQFANYSGMLPTEAQLLISQQLQRITAHAASTMSAGVILGLLFTLWSATQGTKASMIALNIVYKERENRGFIEFNKIALYITLGAIVLAVLSLFLIIALPALLYSMGLPAIVVTLISFLPWLILASCFVIGLAMLYRYAPCRKESQWSWVSVGSIAAAVLWIIASVLFSFYVANFANYNATYGSVGAIVILMLWFYLTALIILLGAELNAQMEHQTKIDTTKGEPQPMGERGAYVADRLGKTFDDRKR